MTALDLVSSRAFRSAGKVVNLVTKMRKLQSLIVAITFCITLGYSTTSCERRKVLSANEELRLPSDQLNAYKLKAEHGDAEAAKKLWHHYTFVAGDLSQGKKWKKAFEDLTKKDDPSFGHIYELPHSLKSTDTAEAQPKETQALLDADWLRSTTEVNAQEKALVQQVRTRVDNDYFVLFSWKIARGEYDFALVPIDREESFKAGFKPSRSGVGGVSRLKEVVAQLPSRSLIVWEDASDVGLELPPAQNIDDVVSFARTKNIRVELNPTLYE